MQATLSTRIHIRSKLLSNLTKEERSQLNRLTLQKDSMMREDILWRTEHLEAVRVFLASDGDKIVGWSSVIQPCAGVTFPVSIRTKLLPIYTYVMRKHRRQGIGKRLIGTASKWVIKKGFKPKVIAWDTQSLRFFDKCKTDYGANIRVTKDFYDVA